MFQDLGQHHRQSLNVSCYVSVGLPGTNSIESPYGTQLVRSKLEAGSVQCLDFCKLLEASFFGMASFSVIELVTAAHCFKTVFIVYSYVSPDSVFKYSAIELHIFLTFFT